MGTTVTVIALVLTAAASGGLTFLGGLRQRRRVDDSIDRARA